MTTRFRPRAASLLPLTTRFRFLPYKYYVHGVDDFSPCHTSILCASAIGHIWVNAIWVYATLQSVKPSHLWTCSAWVLFSSPCYLICFLLRRSPSFIRISHTHIRIIVFVCVNTELMGVMSFLVFACMQHH